ncbi:MAG TPA: hypothetical protein DCK95_04610 [Anaerolineaceae bacterium]|nr:hypothetical protein [Anaerolineaceae bacterium]
MDEITSLKVLYKDEDILAVNKPGGLRTIPDGYDKNVPCLRNILSQNFGEVWVVHRLDKETSGILLFARNANAHRSLNMQFEHREIHKEYKTVVHGSPMWEKKTITIPLLKNGDRHHRTIPDTARGKKAVSNVEVLKRYETETFLSISIESGITHQIRAHLAYCGLPVVGDSLYGAYRFTHSLETYHPDSDKLLLHAHNIWFHHPKTGEPIHIHSLLPPYFSDHVKNI